MGFRIWKPRHARAAGLCATVLLSVVAGTALAGDKKPKNVREPSAILKAIDEIIKADVTAWCAAKGITYPPDAVVLRIFKRERDLEIWAKNTGHEKMQLVKTIPVCSMDFEPGPKLFQGDGKTPEGFYHPAFAWGSKYYWMWMNLEPGRVDERGEPGAGSSFKMCTEYPNLTDRDRTKNAGPGSPGAEICLHGNCVSAGCPSFSNRDFLPVFAFARHHNEKKHGRLQLHLFPFRFDKEPDPKKPASGYTHLERLGEARLLRHWENLKEGFDLFNRNPNPLKVKTGGRKVSDGDKTVRESVYLFD